MLTTGAIDDSPSTLTTRASKTVFVPKPPSMTPAVGMSHLREWLDRKKLQSSSFEIIGETGFALKFSSEIDAAEFQRFEWPSR